MTVDGGSDDSVPPRPRAVPARPEGEAATDLDDDRCWVCGAPVTARHCKIVCPRCGFMRDCSDP